MIAEYIIVYKFMIICVIITLILFSISFFLVYQKPDIEKISAYECGFDPFGNSRSRVEINFVLVGILFIVFDLEISFLFPWAVAFLHFSKIAVLSMIIFVFIITVSFIYEWSKGVLDW